MSEETDVGNVVKCCKMISPCEMVCMLTNALAEMAIGKSVTSYKVGAESFTFASRSVPSLRLLLKDYEQRCNISQGLPSRERAGLRAVFGNNDKGEGCSRTRRCR